MALALVSPTYAVTINGGIGLLTPAGGQQLETWLGEGALALTSIFSHQIGDGKTSHEFHAAADGQGRTFSILEVVSVLVNDTWQPANEVIGGYNPQSWKSSGGYNLTPNDADRTAAIFNLTDMVRRPQDPVLIDAAGQYQTYNHPEYGPTFGGGHDIFVVGSLAWGHVNPFSYGVSNGLNILGGNGFQYVQYGRMEVFTIAADTATVPDGGRTLALMGCALTGLGLAGKRRKDFTTGLGS